MIRSQFLGFYAANDAPRSRQNGIYRISGSGWYAQAYGQQYGYFETEGDARRCLDERMTAGPTTFYLVYRLGIRLFNITLLASALAVVALALCAMMMCL